MAAMLRRRRGMALVYQSGNGQPKPGRIMGSKLCPFGKFLAERFDFN